MEIFTDGEKPYTGMDNAAVINKVQAGYRSPKPPTCTDEFYAVLLSCWNAKPEKRMPFSQIVTAVGPMVPGGTAIQAITFNAGRRGSMTSLYSQSSSDESLDDYADMSGQVEVQVNAEALTRVRRVSLDRDSEVAAVNVAAAAIAAVNAEQQEASAKKKKKKTKKKQGSSAKQTGANDGGYMTVAQAAPAATSTTETAYLQIGQAGEEVQKQNPLFADEE